MEMNAKSKWIVICSPVSGKKNGRHVVENELMKAWKDCFVKQNISIHFTEYPRHAVIIARNHVDEQCGVICVGGDGTVHEVLEALLGKGILKTTPIAILSQGTMNFFYVTAGLPSPDNLPKLILNSSFRPSSLMQIRDDSGNLENVSFEAIHIGPMAYRVTKGVHEWRFLPGGTMFGILLNLLGCNMLPGLFNVRGECKFYPKDTLQPAITWKGSFFWIIITYRNPYNGCVGDDMYVSVMSMENLPSFARRMDFFSPPMEHFCGTSHVFEACFICRKFQFTSASENGPNQIVLDGDPYLASKAIVVEDIPKAWNVVAPLTYLKRLPDQYYKIMKTDNAANQWRNMNPPSLSVFDVGRDWMPTQQLKMDEEQRLQSLVKKYRYGPSSEVKKLLSISGVLFVLGLLLKIQKKNLLSSSS